MNHENPNKFLRYEAFLGVYELKLSIESLAKIIDYAILSPDATIDKIKRACRESIKYKFKCLCVNPTYVSLISKILKKTEVSVCSVINFPFGASLTEVKIFEAEKVINLGAEEIDMVMNLGAFKSKNYDLVREEIKSVVELAHENNVVVKIIIETCYLSEEEKKVASKLVLNAGADFIKTSTGFGSSGAKVEDVKLIRSIVGNRIGIKAAGGIRTFKDALSMIEVGANKIGTSSAVKIVNEFTSFLEHQSL